MVEISTKSNAPIEVKAKKQLEHLLKKYDLSRYTFTDKVLIEKEVIPHSHPILTLNCKYTEEDDIQLATYIHEQLHWFCVERKTAVDKAIEELKTIYRTVPVGYPEGCRTEYSSYLHLIINLLEHKSLQVEIGGKRAKAVNDFMRGHHYTWVYKTVVTDEDKILPIIKKYNLNIEN